MRRVTWQIPAMIAAVLAASPAFAQERTPPDGAGEGNCLTAGCHAPLAEGAIVHDVVVAEACDMCHESTGSGHEFVTPKPIGETCAVCHDDPADATGHVHGPVAAGRCTACHDPHRAEHASLLVRESPELCWMCHAAPARREGGRPVRAVKPEIDGAALVHGAVELGCESCHPPHASEFGGLYTEAFPAGPYSRGYRGAYALCFGCHEESLIEADAGEENGFRDGDRNLHAVHVAQSKSRSCALCHSAHAGGPHLIRRSAPFGDWNLPIGYEETAGGGRCATACHTAREYVRSPTGPPVPGDPAQAGEEP